MHSWPWMLAAAFLFQGLHKIGGFQGPLEELEAGLQELRVYRLTESESGQMQK